MTDSDEQGETDYILSASDSFREGATGFSSGIVLLARGFWSWSDNHPILRWLVTTTVGAVSANLMLRALGGAYQFFYGRTVQISDDIMLGTLPLPVGLSIYLLFTLWVITSIGTFMKLAELRERITEMEVP